MLLKIAQARVLGYAVSVAPVSSATKPRRPGPGLGMAIHNLVATGTWPSV